MVRRHLTPYGFVFMTDKRPMHGELVYHGRFRRIVLPLRENRTAYEYMGEGEPSSTVYRDWRVEEIEKGELF